MTDPENSLQSFLTIPNPIPLFAPVTYGIKYIKVNRLWNSNTIHPLGIYDKNIRLKNMQMAKFTVWMLVQNLK